MWRNGVVVREGIINRRTARRIAAELDAEESKPNFTIIVAEIGIDVVQRSYTCATLEEVDERLPDVIAGLDAHEVAYVVDRDGESVS